MLTIKSLLNCSKNLVTVSSTPILDVELIIAHVLKRNRSYLHAYPEHEVTTIEAATITALLQRREQGEPIAYILGNKEFWTLTFKVTADTLIPRPETELLVELALKKLPAAEPLHIADLGTGSGAIALALAHECPNWQLYATDQSEKALAVAQENAQQHKINNIKFFQGAWCKALPKQKFAAIISNPPYIAVDDPHLKQHDLCFEPKAALVSEQNGLADIYAILQQAKNYLHPEGLILLEHGYQQAAAVRTRMIDLGYSHIETYADLQGLERATLASK